MLYTLPLIAVQASSFLLCVLSMDGGMRSSVSTPYFPSGMPAAAEGARGRTLRSSPDDFRLAQSNGPYPGARATFFEGFLGRSVVAIGASKDDDAIWGFARGTPGCRLAKPGRGGGGINSLSFSIVGI